MRQSTKLSDEQFTASMRDVFGIGEQVPAAVTFEHDSDAIRAAMIRAGVLRPRVAQQEPAELE